MMPLTTKSFSNAFPPFPRSTWIHPDVPGDELDRVCKIIWSRAKELPGRGESSAKRPQEVCNLSDNNSRRRDEVLQKEMDDLGLITQCEEDKRQNDSNSTVPCPYPLGQRAEEQQKEDKKKDHSDFLFPSLYHSICRAEEQETGDLVLITQSDPPDCTHHNVTKPAPGVSPAVDLETKENDAEIKLRFEEKSMKIDNSQSSRGDIQNTDDHTLPLSLKVTRDICESEDELEAVRDCNGGDVTLPKVQIFCTDGSYTDSFSDTNEVKENDIPHISDNSNFDSEQYSSSSSEGNFPQPSTNNPGILACPRQPSVLEKGNGQWETPLSNGTSASMQVQIQEKAVETNPKTDTLPVWQQAYDLLADFPALQAPEKPFVLDEFLHGTPKTKAAEVKRGLTYSKKYCQDSGVSHERRMENLPREVPSICLGDQKSVLKLQTFGLVSPHNSLPVICEKTKARSQLPPRGTDGVGVNARSWASAAKAGMTQAAAPQEKTRPYIFQRIVTINRAKIENSTQRFSNKLTFSHHGSSPV